MSIRIFIFTIAALIVSSCNNSETKPMKIQETAVDETRMESNFASVNGLKM